MALLDADDSWDKAKLAIQCPVFERHPEVVAMASNWRRLEDGRVLTGLHLPAHQIGRAVRATSGDMLRFAFSMTSSTVAARRDALTRHRFDERLVTAEDRDMWIRLVADGPVWFDDAVLTTIVFHNDSLSSSDIDRDCACMLEVPWPLYRGGEPKGDPALGGQDLREVGRRPSRRGPGRESPAARPGAMAA